MQHSEYQVVIPAQTALVLAGVSPTRSSLRIKNIGTETVYIGNGPGVTAASGYRLLPYVTDGPHELALHLPLGDDTTQAYYAFNAGEQDATTVCVMEHCCPKIQLPSELCRPIA